MALNLGPDPEDEARELPWHSENHPLCQGCAQRAVHLQEAGAGQSQRRNRVGCLTMQATLGVLGVFS